MQPSPIGIDLVLGRNSQIEQQQSQKARDWVSERGTLTVAGFACGVLAVVDFFTVVLGIGLGVAAIVLGVMSLREMEKEPRSGGSENVGPRRGMCYWSVGLGGLGILLSLGMWWFVY